MTEFTRYITYGKYLENDDNDDILYIDNILQTNNNFYYNDNSNIKFNFSIDYSLSKVQSNEHTYELEKHLMDKNNKSELLDIYAIIQIGKIQICITYDNDVAYYKGKKIMQHSGNIISQTISKENNNIYINKFSQNIILEIATLLDFSQLEPIAIFLYGSKYVNKIDNISTSNLPIVCTNINYKCHILSLHNIMESNTTGLLAILTFHKRQIKILKVDYYEKGNYNRPSKIHQIMRDKYWHKLVKIEPLLETFPKPYSIVYNDYYEDEDIEE
jgi:hypothetical protein